ncbi:hypothetical protein F2Q68_00011960 [Brassica cretica]|uniref:Uncharacterized protein n=1 Tax=Brassica cretica TaxID=69181 RepID=A0A8S9KQS2_BRACR|nr:hypothetical protein F2Q68_00011960 [Brassica cretica]
MLFSYLGWWRSWRSTTLAKRKGTCDDVQLLLEERGDTIQEEPTSSSSALTRLLRRTWLKLLVLPSFRSIGGYMSTDMLKTYNREMKAGTCLRITKRRGWSIALFQWNVHSSCLFNGYDYLKVMKVQISGPEAL